jgi:serine/threonine protein kinase
MAKENAWRFEGVSEDEAVWNGVRVEAPHCKFRRAGAYNVSFAVYSEEEAQKLRCGLLHSSSADESADESADGCSASFDVASAADDGSPWSVLANTEGKTAALLQRSVVISADSGAGTSFSVVAASANVQAGKVVITEPAAPADDGTRDDAYEDSTSIANTAGSSRGLGLDAGVLAGLAGLAGLLIMAVAVLLLIAQRRRWRQQGVDKRVRGSQGVDKGMGGVPSEQAIASLWAGAVDAGSKAHAEELPVVNASQLKLAERIGFGGASVVYSATFNGYCCSLKIFNPSSTTNLAAKSLTAYNTGTDMQAGAPARTEYEEQAQKQLRREITLTAALRHPCIIRFYGVAVLPANFGGGVFPGAGATTCAEDFRICMVNELATGGSLEDTIKQWQQQRQLQERELRKLPTRLQLLAGGRPKALSRANARLPVTETKAKGSMHTRERSAEVSPYDAHYADVLLIMRQVAEGCAYLHSQGVLHRDLKPANVLLLTPLGTSPNLHIKICDFSTARMFMPPASQAAQPPQAQPPSEPALEHDQLRGLQSDPRQGVSAAAAGQAMTVGYGTLEWMAPELMAGDGRYGEAVDVYGFGMMLYALLTLTEPHEAMSIAVHEANLQASSHGVAAGKASSPPPRIGPAALMHALCNQQLRPVLNLQSRIPTPLIKLIKGAWDPEPKSRPSFAEVIVLLREFDEINMRVGNEQLPVEEARRRIASNWEYGQHAAGGEGAGGSAGGDAGGAGGSWRGAIDAGGVGGSWRGAVDAGGVGGTGGLESIRDVSGSSFDACDSDVQSQSDSISFSRANGSPPVQSYGNPMHTPLDGTKIAGDTVVVMAI